MSEITTPKFFKMVKTVPGDVIMVLHPFSNPEQSKVVKLTNRNPFQNLPLDWALGIFMDNYNYALYKKKIFTFENNDALVKAAYEAGAYFADQLDFEPAKKDETPEILGILKSGNRAKITSAITTYGEKAVRDVAIAYASELTTGVVGLLENLLKVQLVLDGGAE